VCLCIRFLAIRSARASDRLRDNTHHSLSTRSDGVVSFVMAALWNRAGHHIFILWFLSSSIFYHFSSPNLSGRTLDVCHTSAHGVALVRIWDACLKFAARGWLKIQDAKKYAKIAICTPSQKFVGLWAISSQLRQVSIIGKQLVNQQYLIHMSLQYGELQLTNG